MSVTYVNELFHDDFTICLLEEGCLEIHFDSSGDQLNMDSPLDTLADFVPAFFEKNISKSKKVKKCGKLRKPMETYVCILCVKQFSTKDTIHIFTKKVRKYFAIYALNITYQKKILKSI